MRYEVGKLYDQLVAFESFLSGLIGREKSYPIHKRLKFGSSGQTPEFRDLNDLLLSKADLEDGANVLDAGCGVGQTLFDICRRYEVRGVGISVSESEIRIAREASGEQGLSDRCEFRVMSFDDELEGEFDLIIAIESIKHSADLQRTLTNLAGALTDRGQLIIVDDLLKREIDDDSLKYRFTDFWSLHRLIDERSCVDILDRAGVHVREVVDLTEYVGKNLRIVSTLSMSLLTVLKNVLPFPFVRNICSIFIGGFILDRFYADGQMEYKFIHFEKGGRDRNSRLSSSPDSPDEGDEKG